MSATPNTPVSTKPADTAEQVQWRNIRKVVRELADFCFGGQDDPKYGHCHIALTQSLTAKDGLRVELEPLPATPAPSVPLGGGEADPLPCPYCDGEGSVLVPSDNGPDAYDVQEDCPHCGGQQTLADAYRGVVKLLEAERASHQKTYSIIWGHYGTVQGEALQNQIKRIAAHIKPENLDWLRDRLNDLAASAAGYLAAHPLQAQDAAPVDETSLMTTPGRVAYLLANPQELSRFVKLAEKNADDYLELNRKYSDLAAGVQGDAAREGERALRRMLGEQWCASQMVMCPYTDDGQFHDGSAHPGIDFMNDSPAEIRQKIQTRLLAAIPVKVNKHGRASQAGKD